MPYEIGTAAGYTDLLERLKDFLSDPSRTAGESGSDPNITELVAINDLVESGESSQAWTVDEWNDDRESDGSGDVELFMHGPGTAGNDEIYTWIDTYSDVGDDYYNWRLAGMTGYSSGVDISLQPGVTQGRLPRMLMWEGSIPYWFLGNGRRFVVIAKISSVYEMCYGGFALPYGLPTQFPYPMVIGGSACPVTIASHHRYSSLENDHRGFPNPYGNSQGSIVEGVFDTTVYYSTMKVLQGTSWIYMRSRDGNSLYNDNCVWPYVSAAYNYDLYNIFTRLLRENIDGSYPIFPCVVMIDNPSKHIMGELEGCFAVPGFGGIAAEDTFTIDGDTYIAFPITPNASRGDFMCIKKE